MCRALMRIYLNAAPVRIARLPLAEEGLSMRSRVLHEDGTRCAQLKMAPAALWDKVLRAMEVSDVAESCLLPARAMELAPPWMRWDCASVAPSGKMQLLRLAIVK
ncbi:hypothetical protein NDU88_012781 [Pleurodeles waltl]|uniref:Uncharacterized protein n=1 Tax=Pleurodeles waltl TaxID=8319 RepID=A0AAV7R3S9_PLEWA|nr:hypothetical protein NDU88_012781 [Pleurodeles waltl]